MFKQKFTKKYNNPTDGQETKSLGMEQGVAKLHGRSKPELKHSRVCEEEQGMPLQSMKSGTPSFSGGRHAGRQQGLHRQDAGSAHKEFMPRLHPQPGTRSEMLYRQPQLQPGIALWSRTPALQRLTQQGKAWQRHGNVPGGAGVAYEAVEGCVRGGVRLLSYPRFSLPEPSYICSGVSSPLTVQITAVQNSPPLTKRSHLPGQSLKPWCLHCQCLSNPFPGSLLHGDMISAVPLPLYRSHL